MKKMTMKEWENSSMDKKLDASGVHGKEGSAKDKAADKRDLAKYNLRSRTNSKNSED
jgi:hypothetical protein